MLRSDAATLLASGTQLKVATRIATAARKVVLDHGATLVLLWCYAGLHIEVAKRLVPAALLDEVAERRGASAKRSLREGAQSRTVAHSSNHPFTHP